MRKVKSQIWHSTYQGRLLEGLTDAFIKSLKVKKLHCIRHRQVDVCVMNNLTTIHFFLCDLQLYNRYKQYLKKQKEAEICSAIEFQTLDTIMETMATRIAWTLIQTLTRILIDGDSWLWHLHLLILFYSELMLLTAAVCFFQILWFISKQLWIIHYRDVIHE